MIKHKYFEKHTLSSDNSGLVFKKAVKKGTVVHPITGMIFNRGTRDTVQIENTNHVYDGVVIWINHGFEETGHATIQRNGKDEFVTLRDVAKGDPVIFDYTLNEAYIAAPFEDIYTNLPVKYGYVEKKYIDKATSAGFSYEIADGILSSDLKTLVNSHFLTSYDDSSTVYQVLTSDMRVGDALPKLPYMPIAAIVELFGKNADLIRIWLDKY